MYRLYCVISLKIVHIVVFCIVKIEYRCKKFMLFHKMLHQICTIPKATTLVTSQPTLHSTQIEIDSTTVFRLDISIHFKTVIRI